MLPGDVDGDNWVSETDLSKILENWGKCGLVREDGDLNGDGIVEGNDYSEVLSYWNPAPVPAAPEPATLGLLMAAGIVLLHRRLR